MTQTTPPSIPILNQRYRIEEKLGVGRLAVVYRARDERLQRTVLLHMLRKELAPQEPLRQRFIQEAHAGARRSHQSLLEVYDSGEVAGRPFMVTEYVEGRRLRELGRLAVEDALLYFRQVVGAVAACQAVGVPHPPISSNNLILVADGHVELVESWQTSPADMALDLASYRAPERAEGLPPTPASAVYALGLLLFELLAGRRAIEGSDPQVVAQAHLTNRLPPLASIVPSLYSPSLEGLLARATARRPEERLPNAAALAQALDDVRRATGSATQELGPPPVAAPSLRTRLREASGALVSPGRSPATPGGGGATAPQRAAPARDRSRALTGLILMAVTFVAVSCGAYYGATLLLNRLLNVELPRPQIDLPDLGLDLPDWLTGVVSGTGEVLVVTGADLNLRAAPGLGAEVIATLPNGTRVRRLGGPELADDISWYRIRASVGNRAVEGWASGRFLKTETGQPPAARAFERSAPDTIASVP